DRRNPRDQALLRAAGAIAVTGYRLHQRQRRTAAQPPWRSQRSLQRGEGGPGSLRRQAALQVRGQANDERKLTARNVFDCIQFALAQDRIRSVSEIVLVNNN